MAKKTEKKGLGRGLSALLADADNEPTTNRPPAADTLIPIDRILPNPDQPRREFRPEDLQDLANSIAEKGVLQPLILRPGKKGSYEIVAGERRWRAAQMAQVHDVPAVIREFSDAETLEIAIIENMQRADLNPIEEAAGLRQLMDRFGHTQEQLAKVIGKSRSHIANLLRLLNLPAGVVDLLRDQKLSAGHARALIGHENAEALAKQIVRDGLSVRQAEAMVKAPPAAAKPAAPSSKDADTRALEEDLSAMLGMRVQIDHKSDGSGAVSIKYKELEQLDLICHALGTK